MCIFFLQKKTLDPTVGHSRGWFLAPPLQKGHDCPIKFLYALRSCWLVSLYAYCCFVYTHCKQNSMVTVGKSIGLPTILRTQAKVYAENQVHKLFSDLHNIPHAHTTEHMWRSEVNLTCISEFSPSPM